jgi:hypothetical protein
MIIMVTTITVVVIMMMTIASTNRQLFLVRRPDRYLDNVRREIGDKRIQGN